MIAIRSDKKIFDLKHETGTKINNLISEGIPFIIWNNNYYSINKDKVYSLNCHDWYIEKHSFTGYQLIDSRGEMRNINWGEWSDAILFKNFNEYDIYCEKQKLIAEIKTKFNLTEEDIYEIYNTMTRII